MDFILFLVTLLMIESIAGGGGDREIMCIKNERQALVRFKQGLVDDFGVLASWGGEENNTDCCSWMGVTCSNITHHVIALRLQGKHPVMLQGTISNALLDLHHLNVLDLSENSFHTEIPGFFGSLNKLHHLNLSRSWFSGIVPSKLGNLTLLKTLDLSFNLGLVVNNLDWLYHLSSLSVLDLSFTEVHDTNWLQAVSTLPSLKELRLFDCSLTPLTSSSLDFSMKNSSFAPLAVVDLSMTKLNSIAFFWFVNISSSLLWVDISINQLDGHIPEAFGNSILLEHLDMSYNEIDGEIPKSFGDFTLLKYLDMSKNRLAGRIPKSFQNLTSLNLLDLSRNQLIGTLPDLSKLSSLWGLDLSKNKLKGLVESNFGQLSKLEILIVSYNLFEGNVSESLLSNFHNLRRLDLSFNTLTLSSITTGWIPPFQLNALKLACCNMGPKFPEWIQHQNNVSHLDLSCNGILGNVPSWFWDLSPRLESLNLSYNQLSGSVPDLSKKFVGVPTIDISFNNFSGFLPLFHPNSSGLQLSGNMFKGPILSICNYVRLGLLDLSNNQLSGELPNCWVNIAQLMILNLANNSISGDVGSIFFGSFGFIPKALVLRDNNFSGELPPKLEKRTSDGMIIFDVGGNQITGTIPTWMGTRLTHLKVLSLKDNKFHGIIPPELCYLSEIQVLDLSRNNISGRIPQCFKNFTSLVQHNATPQRLDIFAGVSFFSSDGAYDIHSYVMNAYVIWKRKDSEYRKTLGLLKLIDLSSNQLVGDIPKEIFLMRELISLNLSRNHLTGNIDSNIGRMEMLESLDLSRNQLYGEIPVALAKLTYLSVLDLSNNKLSGAIPSSTQLQGFDASAYAGNSGLCGRPLALCPIVADPPISHTDNGWQKYLDAGFYISVASGFILGFWGVIVAILFRNRFGIGCM